MRMRVVSSPRHQARQRLSQRRHRTGLAVRLRHCALRRGRPPAADRHDRRTRPTCRRSRSTAPSWMAGDVFGLGLIGYEMLAGPRGGLDDGISDVMYRQKLRCLHRSPRSAPIRQCGCARRSSARAGQRAQPAVAGRGELPRPLTDDEWVPTHRRRAAPQQPRRQARNAPSRRLRPQPDAAASMIPLNTMQYRRTPSPPAPVATLVPPASAAQITLHSAGRPGRAGGRRGCRPW